MKRRALLLLVLAAGLVGALLFAALGGPGSSSSVGDARSGDALPKGAAPGDALPDRARRIASLSPAITDTIASLGAASSLVLVSDYCRSDQLPRGGTIISPRFERLASARPDLIVATHVAGSRDQDLQRIAPFLSLPWLTLGDVGSGVRRIGAVLAREQQAEQLAQRIERELADRHPADAPRVLLLLGPLGEERIGYFYVRNESLHGRLLTASGYRNAMGEALHPGQPHLSVEQLLRVDPDVILVLQETAAVGPPPLASLTPLSAVRHQRTGVLTRPGILSMGPDILESRRAVEDRLDRMLEEHPL